MYYVCIFDKNHKMKTSLNSHYSKSHQKELLFAKRNKLYCENDPTNIFSCKEQKDKHDEKCPYCKLKKNNFEKTIDEKSEDYSLIENKMEKPKKQVKFPVFKFDEYRKNISSFTLDYLDPFIEQEKYILY